MPKDQKVYPVGTSSNEISEYFLSKWKRKNNAYYLAIAINRHFNNIFNVEEKLSGDYSDRDWDFGRAKNIIADTETTKTCEMVYINIEMSREMRSF